MTEQNQIHNSGLKSQIADAAISYLLSRKLLSEQELSGLELEFGYVFLTEQGAVEALLRLAVRNGQDKPPCFYFALQQGRLIHVKLEEDQFRLYVETMPEMHPCLRREGPEQSRAQLQRRQRSIAALLGKGRFGKPDAVIFRAESHRKGKRALRKAIGICRSGKRHQNRPDQQAGKQQSPYFFHCLFLTFCLLSVNKAVILHFVGFQIGKQRRNLDVIFAADLQLCLGERG